MSHFQAKANPIQNMVREKMLQGYFGEAESTLLDCLRGINKHQVGLVLNGDAALVDVDGGIDILEQEDLEYKKILSKVRDRLAEPENVRKLESERLRKAYQKNHEDFCYHYLEDGRVGFPKNLMDGIISEGSVEDIEKLNILINPYESNEEKTALLISEIKAFGYQIGDIRLFKENQTFGRLTGKVKTLEDRASLRDTDILFMDLEDRESLIKYFSLFEKVGAVIGYASMTSLLAHHDIFHKSKESYMQIPLLLINRSDGKTFRGYRGDTLTLDFKRGRISKK